jgi:hypothetical protein
MREKKLLDYYGNEPVAGVGSQLQLDPVDGIVKWKITGVSPVAHVRLYWVTLLENTEDGDAIIEHIHDVQENEVKYATARLVELALAKNIEIYSIEVSRER